MSDPIPKKDNETTKRQFAFEVFGTFAIVYCGGWSVIQADLGKCTVFGVALQHAFTIAIMVWMGAGISGAHYNSAVSLCFTMTGHIGWKKFWVYNLAQSIGSFIAAGLLRLHKSMYDGGQVWPSGLGFPHLNTKEYTMFAGAMCECLGPFFLCWIALFTALHHSRPKSDVYGICIGGMVGLWIIGVADISGGGLNPQRVLGPCIVSGELWTYDYHYAWIYLGMPYVGGALAGIIYWYTFVDYTGKEHAAIIDKGADVDATENFPEIRDGTVLKHGLEEKKMEIVIRHVVQAKNVRKLTEPSIQHMVPNDSAKLIDWVDHDMGIPDETILPHAVRVKVDGYHA